MIRPLFIILLMLQVTCVPAASPQDQPTGDLFTIGRLKYGGGGDWYVGPTSVPNLLKFIREQTDIPTAQQEIVVSPDDQTIFNTPFLYLTGHGRITFTDEEAARLRRHLTSGGFLFANDSYGLDEHFRREIKKVFPDLELQEVPYDHPIYHCFYDFQSGPPKIHVHDGKPAQGFGIFYQGQLVVYYNYSADEGDGWEDEDVHHDPWAVRQQALQMGTNAVIYALRRNELGQGHKSSP